MRKQMLNDLFRYTQLLNSRDGDVSPGLLVSNAVTLSTIS